MPSRPVVVFCMPDRGHFQRLRSIITRLVRLDVPTHVFTDRCFQGEVEAAGASFVDLFARSTVESTDDESWPFPVRFVTFAASAATAVMKDVEALSPALVVYDTFAVIGKVVARLAGLPHVNVCAGHQVVPEEFFEVLRRHPRVKVSARCAQAVTWLRAKAGLRDASPFWYVSALSTDLNLYCEPPAFLADEHREVFEPVAFYGSLPDDDEVFRMGDARVWASDGRVRRAYVSFGTIVWNHRQAEAIVASEAIATALSDRGVRAVISLGGATVGDHHRAAIMKSGIEVQSYVTQSEALAAADVFITHQGLNSTHEAILHGVPMISYPFIWDQPGLARTCERLGLSTPLVQTPMGFVTPADVDRAIDRIERSGASMRSALATARTWEQTTVADRPHVIQRMLDLGVKGRPEPFRA